MRVALVHDWLTGMRGGEKVLETFCARYPDADILTLLHRPGLVSPAIERHSITTSFVQHLPGAATRYRHYLPLFPSAIERFDLRGYDLVLSTSHCVAKSVVVPETARHICYCFSPMRYAWDQFDAYFGPDRVGAPASRLLYRPMLSRLARWDASTASRPHRFVAISEHVATRIRRYYNREAVVVYPPVDTAFYRPAAAQPETHFLVVSALVPYKRIDLAIAACQRVGATLRVVGTGPDRAALERRAGPETTFLGWLTDEEIRGEYRRAAAVILPGEEDFGIVPLEAQACGRPVVALGRGGAVETILDGVTGVFFPEPTVDGLADALNRVVARTPDTAVIRRHAERFSRERYEDEMTAIIDQTLTAPAGTRW